MKYRVLRMLCVLLAAFMLSACGREPAEGVQGAADVLGEPDSTATSLTPVREFSAETMDGGTFLPEDLAGADLTVIYIWQTTCPTCAPEMPDLARIERALPENVQFVSWCLDAPTYPGTSKHLVEKAGFEGTTLITADGDLQTLVYEVLYTPTTVFLDSEGNHVVPEIVGSPENTVEDYVTSINTALRTLGKETIVLNLD